MSPGRRYSHSSIQFCFLQWLCFPRCEVPPILGVVALFRWLALGHGLLDSAGFGEGWEVLCGMHSGLFSANMGQERTFCWGSKHYS